MTVRTAAAIVSFAAGIGLAGCSSFYEISVETPIQAKIDVSAFQRVLVAGFLTGAMDRNERTLWLWMRVSPRGRGSRNGESHQN